MPTLSKKYLAKEKLVVANIKKDPKSFYSYAKSFQKTHQSVGPFLKGSTVCKDLNFISNTVLQQYSSVFSMPDLDLELKSPENFFLGSLESSQISHHSQSLETNLVVHSQPSPLPNVRLRQEEGRIPGSPQPPPPPPPSHDPLDTVIKKEGAELQPLPPPPSSHDPLDTVIKEEGAE